MFHFLKYVWTSQILGNSSARIIEIGNTMAE